LSSFTPTHIKGSSGDLASCRGSNRETVQLAR